MRIEKEQIISQALYMATEALGLSSNQSKELSEILFRTFADIDFETKAYSLSLDVEHNDVIIKNFIGCKKLAGLRDSSIKAYITTLNQFLNFSNMSLAKVTTDDIRRFLLNYEMHVSNTTADNARRNLNAFFQFMEDEDYIEKNPVKKIKHIKCEQKVKRYYTDEEMETMRDCCEDKREIALVDMLLSTGMRVSEAANIKIRDINWNGKTILVNGKGNKQRLVPMSTRCRKHLKEYLEERKGDSDLLFTANKSPYNSLFKSGVQRIVGRIGDRANLPDITVHCFRRYFASDLCRKGVDIKIIQDILGHKSCNTTTSYYIINDIEKARYMHSVYAN